MLALFLAITLAKDRVTFDEKCAPHFTANQIESTPPAIREGLALYTATERGCATARRFDAREYEIDVFEDDLDHSTGEAPPPGLATLLAANDHKTLKKYDLILNPSFQRNSEKVVFDDEPNTPARMMAAAWAAELLHIDFYSRGISLPHHTRNDFQDEWHELARQLGFPRLEHLDSDDPRAPRRPRILFWR